MEEKQRFAISFSVWLIGKRKTNDFPGTAILQAQKCINICLDLEGFSNHTINWCIRLQKKSKLFWFGWEENLEFYSFI